MKSPGPHGPGHKWIQLNSQCPEDVLAAGAGIGLPAAGTTRTAGALSSTDAGSGILVSRSFSAAPFTGICIT